MNLREGRIGTREGVAVLFCALLSKLLFPQMELFTSGAGNTAWLMNISAALIAALVFLIVLYLLRDGNLLDGLNRGLGLFGRIAALALCVLLLFNATKALSAFYLILKLFVYTDTEPLILLGLLTLSAAVPAYMGFESVTRTAKAFFFVLLFIIACVLIFPWKQYDAYRLFPFWGDGVAPTLLGGIPGSVAYLDFICAAVLLEPFHGKNQVCRTGFLAFALAAASAVLMFLAAALTFSSKALGELIAPFYSMASGIAMDRTLTRIDDFVIFLWILCLTAGISFTLYLASNLFCRVSGVTEIRPVVPLMGLLVLNSALLLQVSAVFQEAARFLRSYGFIIAFGPIALAAVAAFFRRRAAKTKAVRI